MATLQDRNGSFRVLFLYHGKRHTFTLGHVPAEVAAGKAAKVDELLALIKASYVTIPPGMDIVTFMECEGKTLEKAAHAPGQITLGVLRDRYLNTHKNGVLEASTIDGIGIHFTHLIRTFGDRFPVNTITLTDLQQHADARLAMRWRGEKISSATIKKELITLRTVWNWAAGMNLVAGRFPPLKKVRLPKAEEKPPFQTWDEISRKIAAGGLSEKHIGELWDSLYLTIPEIDELLAFVEKTGVQPWVYPLCCFAAHTGARRSELLRALASDVDLASATVLIHERKRRHDRKTTRRIPLTPFLAEVLNDWLSDHPGGQHLFVQGIKVPRSRTRRTQPTPVTPDEAHDHFRRTMSGSKWEVLRGFHVLRHSFISACASQGTDQRLIDEWTGHSTEEQRRRYRHLYPSTQQQALSRVFQRK